MAVVDIPRVSGVDRHRVRCVPEAPVVVRERYDPVAAYDPDLGFRPPAPQRRNDLTEEELERMRSVPWICEVSDGQVSREGIRAQMSRRHEKASVAGVGTVGVGPRPAEAER